MKHLAELLICSTIGSYCLWRAASVLPRAMAEAHAMVRMATDRRRQIDAIEEGEGGIDWEQHYGEFRGQKCRRPSYNTQGGEHIHGGTPYRMNYAGIGYVFREDINPPEGAFMPPKVPEPLEKL
jgi:hypothetical protein